MGRIYQIAATEVLLLPTTTGLSSPPWDGKKVDVEAKCRCGAGRGILDPELCGHASRTWRTDGHLRLLVRRR